jgi:hypothetical protein
VLFRVTRVVKFFNGMRIMVYAELTLMESSLENPNSGLTVMASGKQALNYSG